MFWTMISPGPQFSNLSHHTLQHFKDCWSTNHKDEEAKEVGSNRWWFCLNLGNISPLVDVLLSLLVGQSHPLLRCHLTILLLIGVTLATDAREIVCSDSHDFWNFFSHRHSSLSFHSIWMRFFLQESWDSYLKSYFLALVLDALPFLQLSLYKSTTKPVTPAPDGCFQPKLPKLGLKMKIRFISKIVFSVGLMLGLDHTEKRQKWVSKT